MYRFYIVMRALSSRLPCRRQGRRRGRERHHEEGWRGQPSLVAQGASLFCQRRKCTKKRRARLGREDMLRYVCVCVCVCVSAFFITIVRANRWTNAKTSACSGEKTHGRIPKCLNPLVQVPRKLSVCAHARARERERSNYGIHILCRLASFGRGDAQHAGEPNERTTRALPSDRMLHVIRSNEQLQTFETR